MAIIRFRAGWAVALPVLLAAGLGASTPPSTGSSESPPELGAVRWVREFQTARELALRSGQPLLVLFQEVPGCSTCVAFGKSVLSHPLLVEAIESEFVPVAILNNRSGPDREVLERFGEPAWNNPVVRFIDASGGDLIPRQAGVWSRREIARRMEAALEAADREVPPYLRLLALEADLPEAGRATLVTHCFWRGEACIGDLPGVLATSAAWHASREVLEVRFDASRLSYRELLERAMQRSCAHAVVARSQAELAIAHEVFGDEASLSHQPSRPAGLLDDKRYLKQSPYRDLELTPLQATKMNAALARGTDPSLWLSPRQREELRRVH